MYLVRDRPFDIRGGGGGWDFFEKIFCFPTGAKKLNVFTEVKNKKFVLHLVNFFEALFPRSCKGLQVTQNLTCIKHVDLLGKQYIKCNLGRSIRIFVRSNCCITCSIGSL